jgi:hypothetical protein
MRDTDDLADLTDKDVVRADLCGADHRAVDRCARIREPRRSATAFDPRTMGNRSSMAPFLQNPAEILC